MVDQAKHDSKVAEALGAGFMREQAIIQARAAARAAEIPTMEFTVGQHVRIIGTYEGYGDYRGVVVATTPKSIRVQQDGYTPEHMPPQVYTRRSDGYYRLRGTQSWGGTVLP